jgi:hypothetical protein
MKIPGKKDSIGNIINGGFALSFKAILFIAAYWIVVTSIFYLLIAPLSATVNEISGASDISADAGGNADIKAYFLTDLLPGLSERRAAALNPLVLISGYLLAFTVGAFFTGGLLDVFKASLSEDFKGKIRLKGFKTVRAGDFIQAGIKNFITMILFFLLAATAFLLLNTITASAGRFLKAVAWGMTENEAAAYYTGAGVRVVYYILFLYLAMFLQYTRIAAIFNDEPLPGTRLLSVMRFKEGLWRGYDFLSENRLKAACLFLIILAGTAAWFVLDHLVFFYISENTSFNPLIWSAFTGFGYIFFRIVQYAVAAEFFRFHYKR